MVYLWTAFTTWLYFTLPSFPGWTQIQIYILAAFQQQQNSPFSRSTAVPHTIKHFPLLREPCKARCYRAVAASSFARKFPVCPTLMEIQPGFRRCELAGQRSLRNVRAAVAPFLEFDREQSPAETGTHSGRGKREFVLLCPWSLQPKVVLGCFQGMGSYLQQMKSRLGVRKRFFTKRVVKYWSGLPRRWWSHRGWMCSKKRVDVALGAVGQLWCWAGMDSMVLE